MTAAKKLVSGRVAIDMLAGPSGAFGVLLATRFTSGLIVMLVCLLCALSRAAGSG